MEKTDTAKPKRSTAAKSATPKKSATPAKSAAATKSAAVAAPRKTASRAKKAPQVSPEIRHSMIADAAYYRAKRFGSLGSSDDIAHWLAAEAEIEALLKKGGTLS